MDALLRDPRGRPAGLPLWPFWNCMSFLLFQCDELHRPSGAGAGDCRGARGAIQKARRDFSPGLDTVLKDIRLCLARVSMSTNRKLQNRVAEFVGSLAPDAEIQKARNNKHKKNAIGHAIVH
jgi:hypothetical protein